MDIVEQDFTIAYLLSEYGFPIVATIGLGYFVYFIWTFINEKIEPEIEKQHMQLIRVIDQLRMLDQDLIRLQQKVNVVLEYRENEKKQKRKRVNNGKDKG